MATDVNAATAAKTITFFIGAFSHRWLLPCTRRPDMEIGFVACPRARVTCRHLSRSVTYFATRHHMKSLISLRPIVVSLLALGALAVSAEPTSAQYFGQNKVQYRQLDFKVLHTQHFDIYFYPEEQAGTEIAARMAERWYARLSKFFHHELRGRQPLILYASPTDFQQTNVIPGDLGEGTGGVTEPVRRRIVLPLAGPLADTDHVIGHELVHAFQFDVTTNPGAPAGENG